MAENCVDSEAVGLIVHGSVDDIPDKKLKNREKMVGPVGLEPTTNGL